MDAAKLTPLERNVLHLGFIVRKEEQQRKARSSGAGGETVADQKQREFKNAKAEELKQRVRN